jgi:hypothetical protein
VTVFDGSRKAVTVSCKVGRSRKKVRSQPSTNNQPEPTNNKPNQNSNREEGVGNMKSVRIAGLCLAAMFVMSMVAAGTASAAPHWLVCLAGTEKVLPTKYSNHQCETAVSGNEGKWEWSEPQHTEKVVSHASLTLASEELGVTVKVECVGKDEGWIGPKGTGETTAITVENCKAGTNCEKLEKAPEPVHLPWNSELLETEGKIHATVRNSGAGNPGWRAACKVILKGVVENECTSNEGLLVLENKDTPGNGAALLVLGVFTNKPRATCSHASEGGEVLGSTAFLLASEWALRATK